MIKKLLLALAFVVSATPAVATTYTSCERLALPVPGDPSVANIWGTLINTNTSLVDTALGAQGVISVAGGSNVILTANNGATDQSRYSNYVFNGALTGNIYVLFPQNGCASFSVQNATSGAFTLSVGVNNGSGSAAGNTVTVPQGGTIELLSDGTNVRQRVDLVGLGGSATPQTLHTQVFTASGTFSVPILATANTVFKITVVSGGGGGGGAVGANTAGGGGASGAAAIAWFSGLVGGQTMGITTGVGGTAGGSGGNTGGQGGASSVAAPNSTTIMNCGGGPGGLGQISTGVAQGGGVNTCGVTASGSGLTLLGSAINQGQGGFPSIGTYFSGAGGSGILGYGGTSVPTTNVSAGVAGAFGGGGGSGGATTGTGVSGGAGGHGEVIIEWVL